jgi:hypothetical protein
LAAPATESSGAIGGAECAFGFQTSVLFPPFNDIRLTASTYQRNPAQAESTADPRRVFQHSVEDLGFGIGW